MLRVAILTALLLQGPALTASARGPAAVEAGHPVLLALEREALQAAEDKRQRRIDAAQHAAYVARARGQLDAAYRMVPPTSVNVAARARVLAALEDAAAAGAALDEALRRSPNDPALLMAKGYVRFHSGDFAAARDAAAKVLGLNPPPSAEVVSAATSLRMLSAARMRAGVPAIADPFAAARRPELTAAAIPGRQGSRRVDEIIAEASRLPRAQPLASKLRHDAVERFHSMGDDDAAPAPSLMARISSLFTRDAPTIAEDLAVLRANVQNFALPAGAASLGTTNTGALADFVQWIKTVRPEDLPPIDYRVIGAGIFGYYEMGLLSRGDINMNHHIRSAEAAARSAVLLHEIFHYWDKKVARNHYENVSYGRIGAGTEAQHEYNAYQLTALYWQQFKPQDANSPLARALGRLPTDPAEVQRLVDAAYARRSR